MILTVAAVLVILWLLGFSFSIAGGFVHVLLVIAAIVFIYGLFARHRNSA